METMSKRGRRFERRLAERMERAAVEKKNIFNLLWDACDIADRMEYQQANAVFEIESVMGDMMAMKNVVNARDVERWYTRLGSVLTYLEGGKQNEED